MIPRADRISMGGRTDVGDGKTEEVKALYSDSGYVKDRSWLNVYARVYTDGARALSLRLEAESYEEECPKSCYTYRGQRLQSYNFAFLLHSTFFYSEYTAERRAPEKEDKLYIESRLVSAEIFSRFQHFARIQHLEFRHQGGRDIVQYMSVRDFYLLL